MVGLGLYGSYSSSPWGFGFTLSGTPSVACNAFSRASSAAICSCMACSRSSSKALWSASRFSSAAFAAACWALAALSASALKVFAACKR